MQLLGLQNMGPGSLRTLQRLAGAAISVGSTGSAGLVLILGLGVGCKRSSSPSGDGASASASAPAAPVASGLPISSELVSRAVNPRNEKAYAGPSGALRGRVRAKGDEAPKQERVLAQIPAECEGAREVYGRLFREGPERALADVLVAVTGYSGYVPARESVKVVEASGCAWSSRTIAMTFGQRIEVVSKDRRAYVPELLGSQMSAQIIAMPGGSGSAMYPQAPGRFVLVDSMRIFSTAEVLVLKYATHDVTGLDGAYEILGIPVGQVTLSAVLPATGVTVERPIAIEAGKTLELDLELPFDLSQHAPAAPSSAAPSVSAPVPSAATPKSVTAPR